MMKDAGTCKNVVWGGFGSTLALSPDGKTLAAGSEIIKLRSIVGPHKLVELKGHTGAILGLAYSPDDKLLASSSVDETVRIWDVRTAEEKNKLPDLVPRVWSLTFSPDGKTLATGSADGFVRLWEITP
jgi:WD40 repeat protein